MIEWLRAMLTRNRGRRSRERGRLVRTAPQAPIGLSCNDFSRCALNADGTSTLPAPLLAHAAPFQCPRAKRRNA